MHNYTYLVEIRVIGNLLDSSNDQQKSALFSVEFFLRLVQVTQHLIDMQHALFRYLPYFIFSLDKLLRMKEKCNRCATNNRDISFYEIAISQSLPESLLQIQKNFVNKDSQKYLHSLLAVFDQDIKFDEASNLYQIGDGFKEDQEEYKVREYVDEGMQG